MFARRPFLAAGLLLAVVAALLGLAPARPAGAQTPHARARYLVVYADGGKYGRLGEMYAVFTANLLGRFGRSDLRPASAYQAGEAAPYEGLVYVGAAYDVPPPPALVQDVLTAGRPVLWMQHGVRELAAAEPGFAARYGWRPGRYDPRPRTQVRFREHVFGRRLETAQPLTVPEVVAPAKVQVLAAAEGEGAPPAPWAVKSDNLLYVAEAPFAFMDEDDRYVAFAALLADWAAPDLPARRRALLRIEDVGPDADPARLRAIADRLYAEGVPFSVTVYDSYRDPGGRFSKGRPVSYGLADRPELVRALRYMQASGGTLVMHGHTHQTDLKPNPFARVSGGDYEFFGAVVSPDGGMAVDRPLPGDDQGAWLARLDEGLGVWRGLGLGRPAMFTTPHYAASLAAYRAMSERFPVRYEQVQYFPGETLGTPDETRPYSQFFPYPVRDVRGDVIVPENLGRPAPNEAAAGGRTSAEVVASAERNLVFRDAYASFYRHWYLDPDELVATVRQIKALGYDFVPAQAVAAELNPAPLPPAPAANGSPLSLAVFLGVLLAATGIGMALAARIALRGRRRRRA